MTWTEQAACRGTDTTKHWVGGSHGRPTKETQNVRKLCEVCPVRAACLADALSVPVVYDQGFRAGLTHEERNRLRPVRVARTRTPTRA